MANFDYNPITGQLDLVGSGGGGPSYIDGVADTAADLPVTLGNPPLDAVFVVKQGSGVWLINRKPAGLYCRIANNGDLDDWEYLGAFPEVNADGNWALYNSADPTKEMKFDVSSITTGTTRTLTVPDKNITIADDADIPSTLNDLSNVSAATPSDNDVLAFDTATGNWVAEAAAAGGIASDTTGITGASAITNIVAISQADYDDIASPDAATLFIITD